MDGLRPAVRATRNGYVASSLPLAGKDQGKRAQADELTAERLDALPEHHCFRKHSGSCPLPQRKVDNQPERGHTHRTMTRAAQAVEHGTPVAVRLLMLGLVILSVFVILPR